MTVPQYNEIIECTSANSYNNKLLSIENEQYIIKILIYGRSANMEVRFPNVDWFCDNCDSYLNRQRGFDDRKYIWKCRKCGYKNSISAANIRHEDPIIHNIIGFILGYARSLLVYAITILVLSEIIFKKPVVDIFGYRLLFLSIVAYPIVIVLSLFFERVLAKYGIHKPLGKWILSTIPLYCLGDYFRPFQEVLGFPVALLNLIRLKLKGITLPNTSGKSVFMRECIRYYCC